MAEVNKEELRRLAEVLGGKEWGRDGSYVCTVRREGETTYVESWNAMADCPQPDVAEFVGRSSPAAVLSLLDENAAQSARIAELEREIERFKKAERDALRAELEACRKDAERWRHMRDLVHPEEIKGFQEARKSWSVRPSEKISQQCDAVIDAAMQEGGV